MLIYSLIFSNNPSDWCSGSGFGRLSQREENRITPNYLQTVIRQRTYVNSEIIVWIRSRLRLIPGKRVKISFYTVKTSVCL